MQNTGKKKDKDEGEEETYIRGVMNVVSNTFFATFCAGGVYGYMKNRHFKMSQDPIHQLHPSKVGAFARLTRRSFLVSQILYQGFRIGITGTTFSFVFCTLDYLFNKHLLSDQYKAQLKFKGREEGFEYLQKPQVNLLTHKAASGTIAGGLIVLKYAIDTSPSKMQALQLVSYGMLIGLMGGVLYYTLLRLQEYAYRIEMIRLRDAYGEFTREEIEQIKRDYREKATAQGISPTNLLGKF